MYLSPSFLWFTQAPRRAAGTGEEEEGATRKVQRGGQAKKEKGKERGGEMKRQEGESEGKKTRWRGAREANEQRGGE